MDRGEATCRFYELLEQLEVHIGGSQPCGESDRANALARPRRVLLLRTGRTAFG